MAAELTYLVGLGATKAGTSWLHDQLASHPDCHFRTIKELHYFDAAETGDWKGAIRATKVEINRFTSLLERQPGVNLAYRTRHLSDLTEWLAVLRTRVFDLASYLAFLVRGLPPGKRLVGDITPAYALLPEARLTAIQTMAPDTRFVYLMRDPVDRLWSHVRMIAERMAPVKEFRGEYALELLRAICRDETAGELAGIKTRGDYAAALGRMGRALDPSRLLVMFQENLMQQSGMDQLTDFLGIRRVMADLGKRVHEGFALALPAPDRAMARAWLAPQYEFVGARLGQLPQRWRDSLEGDA